MTADHIDYTPEKLRELATELQHSSPWSPILQSAVRALHEMADESHQRVALNQMVSRLSYQSRVNEWLLACFGLEITSDRRERGHRFLEEALELVQSIGCGRDDAHSIVDYVYGRDVGEVEQEVGGVMVCLAALCNVEYIDMLDAGEVELERVWTKIEKIREKHARKPKFGIDVVVPAEQDLLTWAVGKWNNEVRNRPLNNIYRRTLDTTWRQVIRIAGGDPDDLVGPAHDELLDAAKESGHE